MKTWQWSMLCVLLCIVGLNSVAFAWPLDITLSSITNRKIFIIWDGEVQVSPSDARNYSNPSIAGTPDGNLYVAYENKTTGGIMLSRSTDGGLNWGIVTDLSPDSASGITYHNPTITYLKIGAQKMICVVYAVDHPDGSVSIVLDKIGIEPVSYLTGDTIVDGLSTFPDYEIYPEICTDYPLETSNPYLYVTYSSKVGTTFPVRLLRSPNLGQTWDMLTEQWNEGIGRLTRPDIEYGSAGLFLVYNQILNIPPPEYNLYEKVAIMNSTDRGDTWSLPVQIYFSRNPIKHPRITAAIGNPSVLVAYTTGYEGNRDIEYAYSSDGGNNWVTNLSLAISSDDERDVELGRSRSGETFYAAYWRGNDVSGNIRYTSASTARLWIWTPSLVINEGYTASSLYSKPSVYFHPIWPEQEACIAWTDDRSVHSQIYLGTSYRPDIPLPGSGAFPPYPHLIGAGETMSYTVTVENIFEDLNTLTVTNQLSALVAYTSGAVALNGVVQEPLAVTDGLWTYTTADLAYGDLLTFSFDVVVDAGVDPGDLISNLINVQYVYGLSNTLLEYSREVAVIVGNVPEPATWALLGLGLLGGGLLLRRKHRARTR